VALTVGRSLVQLAALLLLGLLRTRRLNQLEKGCNLVRYMQAGMSIVGSIFLAVMFDR
jgi:hypothetical protein